MIGHPEEVVPAEGRLQAYSTLIQALAIHEPEALARAAAAIEDEGAVSPQPGMVSPAAVLARSWLAFAGRGEGVTAQRREKVYTFSYPATVGFEMVGTAGKKAAKRLADKAVARLLSGDLPLCAIQGPFPGEAGMLNVEVWLGTVGDTDEVEIEGVDPTVQE